MPELPEVETVRRGLAPVMEGGVIARAEARRPDLRWPLPVDMAQRLTGARVLALRRRSKYLLIDLDLDRGLGLGRSESLIVHLGMSGRMVISDASGRTVPGQFHHAHPAPATHDHVLIDMASGVRVTFNDPRRFGAMDLCPTDALDAHRMMATLGPEPLGNAFNDTYLHARLMGRKMPVKAALLDQRIVAGLGNIYVCEALFRAGIDPKCPAGGISAARIARLVQTIRETLHDAIAAGGSSLRDYRQADGALGYFQHAFQVYGRAGAPCLRAGCAGVVQRVVQSGRSTFHCPCCQR